MTCLHAIALVGWLQAFKCIPERLRMEKVRKASRCADLQAQLNEVNVGTSLLTDLLMQIIICKHNFKKQGVCDCP